MIAMYDENGWPDEALVMDWAEHNDHADDYRDEAEQVGGSFVFELIIPIEVDEVCVRAMRAASNAYVRGLRHAIAEGFHPLDAYALASLEAHAAYQWVMGGGE